MTAVNYDDAPSPIRDDATWYEMNTRRRPVPLAADNVPLVESLRFAVPLWILEQRDATPGDLVRAGKRCAWAVGERGDSLQFRAAGEPTGSERNSAALAFEGLARGLAAIALLEGRVDFAGLHWCTSPHPDCPNPAPQRRTPVEEKEVRRVVDQLDELERLLTALSDPDRDDGPELPAAQQCDPDDPGLWAIWSGGPIKAGHEASAARANRAWQRIRDTGGRPECGDGMFGEPAAPRGTEQVTPAGDWADAL